MTSNFNSNRRTQEYNFKSKLFDDYPTSNINSVNYDTDNGWVDNSVVTPRLNVPRRLDTQSIRSSNFNDNATKSKDEFTIFGSFVRQTSERKSINSPSERSRTVPRQSSVFKNLPVKSPQGGDVLEYTKIVKTENVNQLQSQPKYTPQSNMAPNSLFDLIQSQDEADYIPVTSTQKLSIDRSIRIPVEQEMLVAQRNVKAESALTPQSTFPQFSLDDSSQNKDKEIAKLQKSVENKNKKITVLKDNNEKLQEHLKNLLNERKQLLSKIENTETEEIIEEEEVQEAKPHYSTKEIIKPVEISHANCLQRENMTLEDVPSRLLDVYRNEIGRNHREENQILIETLNNQQQKKLAELEAKYDHLQRVSILKDKITMDNIPRSMLQSYNEQLLSQIKEQTELDKRSLVETLKTQQQKKIADLQAEYETVKRVSVQSIKKTRFNQIVSEANIPRPSSPKPSLESVGVQVLPTSIHKQCQSEIKGITPTSTSIGICNTPVYSTKSTGTVRMESLDVSTEFNTPVEVVKKPVVTQDSKSVTAKPILLQRGCQPEEPFKFETGTMTDQTFCRSQGMMTIGDYTDHKSPLTVDQDSIINKSMSRSESRKQTISQTRYVASPSKEFATIHEERALSPRITKPVQKIPESVVEDIVEIKTFKVENKPKPINVTEEVKHVVEEKTHLVTTILDQNKVPKQEIPTMIECWETVSHLKDGEVIDKHETYHDQLVSTDIEKIREHLDRFNFSHSNEVSPTTKVDIDLAMKFDEKNIKSKITSNTSSLPLSGNESVTKTIETTTIRNSSTSSDNSNSSPDIKDKNVKPLFRKPSLKYEASDTKKSSDIREIKVQEKKVTEKTNTSTILSKPVEVKESVSKSEINESTEKTFGSSKSNVSEKREIKFKPKIPVPSVKKEVYKESTEVLTTNITKKPIEIKEIKVVNKLPQNLIEKTIIRESKTINEPIGVTEIKIRQNLSASPSTEIILKESNETFRSTKVEKPVEIKNVKVQHSSPSPTKKETIYQKVEQTASSRVKVEPRDNKEVKVVKTFSAPVTEKTFYEESERTVSSSSIQKPIEVREIEFMSRSSKEDSQHSFQSGITTQPEEVKEIKVQQSFSTPIHSTTIYHETEERHSFTNSENPVEVKEIKVQLSRTSPGTTYHESQYQNFANDFQTVYDSQDIQLKPYLNESTYYKSGQTITSADCKESSGIKGRVISENFAAPTVKETSYEETEQIITYTTTTSTMPVTSESDAVKTRTSNTFSSLTSPKAFQSYSLTKGRSNFSSSKLENYSFESDTFPKLQSIPIEIKTTPTHSHNIQVNDATISSKTTRIPINLSGSSSIASSNSAFRSLYSSTEQSKTTPLATTDVSEILLSESIFKCCTDLLIWLKSINLVTESTVEFLPSDLITVSSTLIDWWVDVTVKLDYSKLMATVQYITSTFSKNLLKYLIINLDQQGNSCLHYIIGHQMWDSFSVLEFTKLVDPNIYNSQGYTVLMVASTCIVSSDSGRDNLRRLAQGANMNLTSKVQGQSAILIAALHNNSYMIQMLYALGADINLRDNEDNTPLIVACSKNHVEAVTAIMTVSDVLIDLKNKDGKTAFVIAEESGFVEIVEIIKHRKSTRASEISSYSKIMQSSFSNRTFSPKKY